MRLEDVASATQTTPVTLLVVGEVAAGDTGAYALTPGTAIKIMTGAMLPRGTEAIVPVEWTDGGNARVAVRGQPEFGQSVRLAGGDAKQGQVLVAQGTRLRPMHIAVIAAAGRGEVLVWPRPRVVMLSTGSEFTEPGMPIVPSPDPGLQQLHDRRGGPRRAARPTGRPSSGTTRRRCCPPSRTSWSGPT